MVAFRGLCLEKRHGALEADEEETAAAAAAAADIETKDDGVMLEELMMASSLLRSETVSTAVVVAQDGRLPARSPQSERLKSRLSNVEKLLREESQLKFWLRLFWKLVTTPLDELELAYEFSRWMGIGTAAVEATSSISERGKPKFNFSFIFKKQISSHLRDQCRIPRRCSSCTAA